MDRPGRAVSGFTSTRIACPFVTTPCSRCSPRVVTARFVLFRAAATTASGPFTLVLERRADGWKILHDHSSSDPK
jgi:hypothetical protein